ncbi:hypothetical protein Tco_1066970 [Tanacetum coccineum]|uniref:Retrovirus-related Pol polyprotein from transposon TNT 1-94-like beta-barrel domain-containing protein n=1 Tax=Tanacetum coccineum TaxID=301880 RepID=A0ABQ5HDR0_9ASTR
MPFHSKWALATSHKKNNKPYVDASRSKQTKVNNTKKHAVKQNTQKTDNTMLPFTGRVSYTDASGSKPKSNTRNDKIPRPSRRSKKNKVDVQPRKSKSSSNKNNHISDFKANIKNVALSKSYANVCLSCNECLFSENHDACVVKYLKAVQKCKKAKSVTQKEKIQRKATEIVLWYLDSGYSKHMTRQCDKLINFVSMFIGTVRFNNDHFAAIIGYRDLQIGNITILRVYYIEGLGNNLFPVGKFCDSDLEVASINRKRYILVITDDYSQFTWVKFLRTKDETLEIIIKILKHAQVSLNATDLLFQPMFDEYFKPPSDVSTTISVATLPPPDTARASSSTTIDQDALSLSTSSNNELTSPLINSTNVEEPNNKEEA